VVAGIVPMPGLTLFSVGSPTCGLGESGICCAEASSVVF
jgi:hypothetical protein